MDLLAIKTENNFHTLSSQNQSYFTPAGEILLRSQPNTPPAAAETMLFGFRELLVRQVCKVGRALPLDPSFSYTLRPALFGL